MAITLSAKGPNDVIRYSWEPPLASGDTLESYTLAATGCTIDADSLEDNAAAFFVSGGTAGVTASIAATALSGEGEEFEELIYLPIYGPAATIGDTARDYVDFALRKIAGLGEEADADELADGIEQLNGMLTLWRIDGLDVGASLPLMASSVLKIRDEFSMAVKYNLRVLLHSTYGAEAVGALTQADINMAADGKRLVAQSLLSLDDLEFENALLPHSRETFGYY